jgi:thymidylate kinase
MINPEPGLRPTATADHLSPPQEKLTGISPRATKVQVLQEIFRSIHQAGLNYAVLRNYAGLPEKPGRDVDILTNNFEKFRQIIESVSEHAGYSVRIFRRYDSLVKFHLISEVPETCEVLEIDVAWDIRWRGLPLVAPDLLGRRRLWRKEFYTLQPGPEAAISLIKDLMAHGAVKEKYKPGISEMIRTDRDGFLQALAPSLGLPLVSELAALGSRGEWGQIAALVPQLRRQAAIRALRRQPLAQAGRWAAFLWWNLWKFFRPSGLFVVLIGPDGSGKSTVAAGLQQLLEPLFQGKRYYHGHFKNLPRLRDLAHLWGYKVAPETPSDPLVLEKGRQDGSGKSKIKSMFSLLYYGLDYVLGYPAIFRGRGRGELILFDRYYYDYLIQPGMAVPDWCLTLMMSVIPKPDAVIYLQNNPEVILARKAERTRAELEQQGALCSRLISQLPQGRVVETTGTPEETITSAAEVLLQRFRK